MKKLLALMLVLVLAFSIVSCTLFGDDKDKNDNTDGTNDSNDTNDTNDTNDGGNSGNTDDGDNPFGDDEGIELPIVDVTPD